MNSQRRFNLRAILIASAVVAVAFAGLGVFSFTRSTHRTKTSVVPYAEQVTFAYSASVPSSPVYPNGAVHTGDPIFLQYVHQLHVQVGFSLTAAEPARVAGTDKVALRLTGPTGWSQTLPLSGVTRFTGGRAETSVTLDLKSLQALIKRVQTLSGVRTPSGYTISVVPQVHIAGSLAGQPLATSLSPVLGFQLAPPQLRPSGAFTPVQHGSVATTSSVENRLKVAGVSVPVKTLRFVALAGFVLVLLEALLVAVLVKRSEPFGEAGRIQAQYGHLIVPIAGTAEDLAWAPFDVPNIESLVRLAEACDRLILHYREDTLDTYLVNDEGTVYRYQSRHSGVVWGEWSTAPVAKLDSVPPPAAAKEAA